MAVGEAHGSCGDRVSAGADLRVELELEVRRVADRLRTLSQARLAQAAVLRTGGARVGSGGTRADAGRRAARSLAAAAAAVEALAAGGPPGRRELPHLPDLAVGDQVAVTGADLAAALAVLPTGVPTPAEVAAALGALRAARRVL